MDHVHFGHAHVFSASPNSTSGSIQLTPPSLPSFRSLSPLLRHSIMSRLFTRLPRARNLALGAAGTLTGLTAYSVLTAGPADDILPADPASLYYTSRHLRMEGQMQEHLDRPSATWTPPTRAAQLAALGCEGVSHAYGTGHGAARELIGAAADKIGLGSYVDRKASDALDELSGKKVEEFDLLVVGGGATGAGVALDAASRGLKVAVVERDDFSSGECSFQRC